MRALTKLLPILAGGLLSACAIENPGVPPPLDRFHYPVSVAWLPDEDPAGLGTLYVVNSNFDLRFNRGSVMAVDLDALEQTEPTNIAQAIGPNGVVFIDSFGGKNALYAAPGASSSQRRMFVPTRSNHRLYAVDLDGPALGCVDMGGGPAASERDCLDTGLSLSDGVSAQRAEDPFGVAVRGRELYVTHLRPADDPPQTGQNFASWLVRLDVDAPSSPPEFIPIGLSPSEAIVDTPVGIYFSGLFTSLTDALRRQTSPQPLRLYADGQVVDTGVSTATSITDVVGLALSSDGQRLFATTRLPDGLLILDIAPEPASGQPRNTVLGFVHMPRGASELHVVARPGRRDLVAVSGTTANQVALYDDELGQVAALVSGIRQPYGIASGVTPGGGVRLYVASFEGFTVDVIDIPDPTRPRGAVLAKRIGTGAEVPFPSEASE